MSEFDREWYEYLQRLFRDREAAREFAKGLIEQADLTREEEDEHGTTH